MRRRITDLVFCAIGCAVLSIVGFQIWRGIGQPNIIDPPQPDAKQEQPAKTVGTPPPYAEAPSVVEKQPAEKVESADNNSVFHLTAFAVPASTEIKESFDQAQTGSLPTNWAQWATGKDASFQVAAAKSLSGANVLTSTGASSVTAFAWPSGDQAADFQASAGVNLTTLIAAGVFVRGKKLDSGSPSYYAASVSRGLELQLLRVVDGKTTKLGTLKSSGYISEKWVRVTIQAEGKTIRARVCRLDDLQYLNKDGTWQNDPTWALNANDSEITEGGEVGVARFASVAGTVSFDDFEAILAANDKPAKGNGPAKAAAPAKPGGAAAPASTTQPPKTVANPLHDPPIPRHYSHIRIAMLAYGGNPMGEIEDKLLKESVDLVVPNTGYLKHLSEVSPNTPRLIYSNTSNIYLELLTDWLAFADANGLAREAAFYHASHPQPFKGDSPSSRPVTWFWGVYRGGKAPSDLTSAAHAKNGKVEFAGNGDSLYLGYTDKFREINVELTSGAKDGWSAALEYAKAVDKAGKPTEWAALTTLSDSTNKLTQSGRIEFDPPANWTAASVGGSAPLFYVRFHTTAAGKLPVAQTILGRDFVGANGKAEGVIPAFDAKADLNKDGYLDDAEYAKRATGKDARFLYESRIYNGGYGQMRFCTNPGNKEFHKWAVDWNIRLLAKHPLATGLFMDNSSGKPQVKAEDAVESPANYSAEYGELLQAVWKAIEPKWILANTGGGFASAEPVIQRSPAYFEEFSVRPMSHSWSTFDDLAKSVERRSLLTKPAPIAVLDSHSQGGGQTDARTLIGVLAYYYLLADPDHTFLMFFGGQDPNGTWAKHWTPAVSFDVGKPEGKWSELATGTDPANKDLTYKVLQRPYTNALILYRPLSHVRGNRVPAVLGDESATKHEL
ncbi:MAG TPA: hypothetical protein VGG61_01080, partial [Gemmataceae bacterium]